jgi:short-subunit dehydrogenase
MKDKLKEIKSKCGRSDFKGDYVVADFAKLCTIEEYKTNIADKLKDKNVGVLILNAGTAVMGPFKDITDKEVQRTVNVNALHPIYLIKTMIPQLL